MTAIRTIVVDDEKPARMRVLDLLAREPAVRVVGEAADGWQAVELVRACAPRLMFLDVQMPGLDGFGVLRAIEPARLPAVVFVTAYDTYAIQAFEAHALDYLVKPFSDERFGAALRHVLAIVGSAARAGTHAQSAQLMAEQAAAGRRSGFLERLVLKANGRITFLNVDEVDWIQACGVYVHLHAGPRTHLYRSSIAQLLQRLDPDRFVRVHRSLVVNTDRIKELQPRSHGDYTIILKDGTELAMSRWYRPQLEGWLRQSL